MIENAKRNALLKGRDKLRVLVVDDEEIHRELLGELIRVFGYELQVANNRGVEGSDLRN